MHIFVTGGTGFIGQHVLAALEQAGHRVTALRHPLNAPVCADHDLLRWLAKPMDELGLEDFGGVDVLLHLASPGVPPRKADWQALMYWNVTVLQQLMAAAHTAGVRRCVVAGSYAEYGRSADTMAFIPADAPLLPTYAYAASKAAASVVAGAYAIEQNMELCYLRIFSVFGDGQYIENFWPALRQAALDGRDFAMTPGEQVRDYVEVEAVARAFVGAVERTDVQPGLPWVRNVGTGTPVSMTQFATQWWNRWNPSGRLLVGGLPYRPNEIMRCVPQIDPAVWNPPK